MSFRLGTVASTFLLTLLSTTAASAYCRSTTCELSETPTAPCGRSSDGCVTEGEPLRWKDRCISYAVQLDGSEQLALPADSAQGLLQEAFAFWARAECPGGGTPGFQAIFSGFVSCDQQQVVCGGAAGNESVLIFQDREWPSVYPADAAGLTSVIADLDTGEIVDADLEINTASYSFDPEDPAGLDLSLVVIHEVGHFLGLAHSREAGAIMRLNYQEEASFVLSDDDIAGICAIYPPTSDSLSCLSGGVAYDACIDPDLSSGQVCTADSARENEPEPEDKTEDSSGCSLSSPHGARPGSRDPLTLLSLMGAALTLGRWRRHNRAI